MIVDQLACVLFEVKALDADDAVVFRARTFHVHLDQQLPSPTIGWVKLADLVALRQVSDRNNSCGRTGSTR